MELSLLKTQAYGAALLSNGGVLIETDEIGYDLGVDEPTYWGVLCRSCAQLIAFDVCPNCPFRAEAPSGKPCTIRCGYGHSHLYQSRDFQFFFSDFPIDDAVMQWNREAYKAINRPPLAASIPPGVPKTAETLSIPATFRVTNVRLSGHELLDLPSALPRTAAATLPAASIGRTVKRRKYGWFAFILDLLKEAIAVRMAPLNPGRTHRKVG